MSNKLTAKQESTVEYYCNPTSKTFNNLLQSMVKAGYTQKYADHHGWELVGKDHIKKAMVDYKASISVKQAITVEYIQQEHQRLAALAEANGDLATATRNKEGLGRTIAAYTDKYQDGTTTDRPVLTPEQQERYKILAREMTKREHKPKTA